MKSLFNGQREVPRAGLHVPRLLRFLGRPRLPHLRRRGPREARPGRHPRLPGASEGHFEAAKMLLFEIILPKINVAKCCQFV